MNFRTLALLCATAMGTALAVPAAAQDSDGTDETPAAGTETQELGELRVLDTAEQEGKQALGTSIITAADIEKDPPENDLSEIIRRQPGINLTGNSASGAFGNNRQIDIRGMGPENTFVLIDGKPVLSRNSVKYGRNGERNTRGDTNWVPAEEVERIEILRGPAAARYGSGAAGGVINIITKGPAKEFRGSVSGFVNIPESSLEGGSKRFNASVAGPVADWLSYRVYGSYNITDGDDARLNAVAVDADEDTNPPAGREGVENKDINGMLRFTPAQGQRVDLEGSYSRQGNRYAGEYILGNGSSSDYVSTLADENAETNVMERWTTSLNYQGDFDFGTAKLVGQYEHTDNTRLTEGQYGGGEGTINTETDTYTSTFEDWYVNGSLDIPFTVAGAVNVLTVGGEFRWEKLDDPFTFSSGIEQESYLAAIEAGEIPGVTDISQVGDVYSATTYAAFVEDNIVIGHAILTPGVRFDHQSQFGSNWSPSLSVSYEAVPDLVIKGGIARAFKAPNLYQTAAGYLWRTRGNGCPIAYPSLGGGCWIMGNPDLKAETSVNKEIGIAYSPEGFNFSVTYFRNDYNNKIVAGNKRLAITTADNAQVFVWTNAPKAIVEGLEGNLLIPLARTLRFNTNATYMIQNKNKTTGELLSVVPKYTINSTLDWDVSEEIGVVATFTRYGKQKPNGVFYSGEEATEEELQPRKPYNLVGLTVNFRPTKAYLFTLGVSNLFNERLFREDATNGAGANNYNERGRAFFVKGTVNF